MAGNKFEVVLGADGKPLSNELADAEKKLKSFQKQVESTGQKLSGLKPGANQASAAVINFSRVIQDAPYGVIGFANNLDPLLLSLQQTARETGSTGAAIKAFASSLLGAGGIALGLSVVTSLLTAAVQKYGSLDAALKAILGNTTALEKMQKGLRDAMLETNKAAGEEIAKLNILSSAASDVSRSMTERRDAARALVKQLNEYNISLTEEAALNGEVARQTLAARDAILARAKATAIANKLSEVESRILDIEVKRVKAVEDLADANTNLGKAQNVINDAVKAAPLSQASYALAQYKDAVTKAKNALIDLGDQEARLRDERTFLTGLFEVQDLPIPKKFEVELPKIKNSGKTFEQLFADINEEAGQGWQKLIDFSEKEADRYFDAMAKRIQLQSNKQKIIDEFNRTNEAIKKGIVGFSAGGSLDLFGGQNIKQQETIGKIRSALQAAGQTPIDTSWLSDQGAQLLLLNEQWTQYNTKLAEAGMVVQQFLAPAFGQFFENLFSGTMSAGEALKSFFTGLLKQIAVTIAQAAALAAVMQAFGLGGAGATFGSLFRSNLGMPNVGAVGAAGVANINVSGVLRGQDIYLSGQRGGNSLGRIGLG